MLAGVDVYDWELYRDWCEAADLTGALGRASTVNQFLDEVPSAASMHRRRVRSIRYYLDRERIPHDLPPTGRATVAREGPGWADLPRALEQAPWLRYPQGLRGRRDAFLLVLLLGLRLDRPTALSIGSEDITVYPELRIRGYVIPRGETTARCQRCAITRWLRVVEPASRGARVTLIALMNPVGADDQAHDCDTGLDGSWRYVETLAPAIDQYGWTEPARPLSLNALSHLAADRQRLAGVAQGAAPAFVATGRYKDATSAELAEAYDEADAGADALLALTRALLDDADELFGRVDGLRGQTTES
jgi:hypothetical protein